MPHHYRIRGLDDDITAAVRSTRHSPEYGHPAVAETARGTGPCRACLDVFTVGRDERILFTYRPAERDGTVGAPGPVFIHAHSCVRYEGSTFPPGLRSLPLLFEGRASGNRIIAARAASGDAIDAAIDELLSDEAVGYLHLRHADAGCHIARITRAPVG